LDVTDETSVVALKDFVKEKYPTGINILVNNAGVGYAQEWHPVENMLPFKEILETTMKPNFWSMITMHKHLAPLLAENARVVNLSSTTGIWMMKQLTAPLRDKLLAITTVNQLSDFVQEYEKAALSKDGKDFGYPEVVYAMSKLFMMAMTKIHAKELEMDPRNIAVNCCCPGYVATDMTLNNGFLSVEEGVVTPIYLALLPERNIQGQFVKNQEVYDWETAHLNDMYNYVDLGKLLVKE